MLTVDHYELIRREVENKGKSQRDVAKELGHSRKTVSKALKLRLPPATSLPGLEKNRSLSQSGIS